MKLPFRILGINHLGLVPKSPEIAQEFLSQILLLEHDKPEEIPSQKVRCTQFFSSHQQTEPMLEILVPTEPNSPIAKFLEERKGGIHHLALEVDNIQNAATYLKEKNISLLSDTPLPGSHGTQVLFIHPRSTGGILIELVQR